MDKYPRVGVGVLVIKDHKFLVGQRHGAHGSGSWAPPGGHIEWEESAEEAAIREVYEETGLIVDNPRVIGVTNAVFKDEQKHYITVYIATDYVKGELTVSEPDKFDNLQWVDMESIPQPMFLTWSALVEMPHTRRRLIEELA